MEIVLQDTVQGDSHEASCRLKYNRKIAVDGK